MSSSAPRPPYRTLGLLGLATAFTFASTACGGAAGSEDVARGHASADTPAPSPRVPTGATRDDDNPKAPALPWASPPAATPSMTSSEAATPLSPSGLMMRQGVPPGLPDESFITSSVAMVNWADIQPDNATDPAEWSTLDKEIAALAKAGVSDVRLRIMAGGQAPTWVKRLGGPKSGYFNGVMTAIDCSRKGQGSSYGGVAVQNSQGPTACVPFFWTDAYLDQYDALMNLLAARLASDSKYDIVSTIVDSACMAVYAEVFYRGQDVGPTNETLYEAGLTHDADIACQKSAIKSHKNAFGTARRTSVAINDWDIVQGTAGSGGEYRTKVWYDGGTTWATYEFAEWARAELTFAGQTLLEVQNNGLHSTGASCAKGDTGTASYWCYISQYPGRHGFQTQSYKAKPLSPSGASLTLLEDLDNGLALHAQYIELPSGMTAADWKLMACYDAHFLKGDTSACPH